MADESKAKEEWIQLIQEAKQIGLTIEEVRDFIRDGSAASFDK